MSKNNEHFDDLDTLFLGENLKDESGMQLPTKIGSNHVVLPPIEELIKNAGKTNLSI